MNAEQLDLIRHSDSNLALAFRIAAETARRNPWFSPEVAEERARYYEQQAKNHERR